MTTNEEIRDQAIAHQVYLLRYQAQIVRKVTEILKETEADIKAQLAQINTESRTQELEAQLVGIKALIDASWAAATKELATELSALVEYEATHQDAVIQEAAPVRLSTVMPAPELLIAAVESKPFEGKLLSEWIDRLQEDSFIRIRDAVRMGVVEGQTYDQITKRVVGTKALQYSDGVLALNYRQAQALVATAVSHTTNEARQTFYVRNEDLIKGVQWISTLDARTCWSKKSLVLMADGSHKPIGDIVEGEFVIGGVSGDPCKVIGTFVSVVPSSIAIHYNDVLIGRTTHDHKMLTPNGWKRTEELCLSSDLHFGEVVCRSFFEPKTSISGALEQSRNGHLCPELCAEEIRRSAIEDSCGNEHQSGSVCIGSQVHSGKEHACSERVQHDERRGGIGSFSGKICREGETVFGDASDKSRSKTEAIAGCQESGSESIERQQEVLCDRCRERVFTQKIRIFLEGKHNQSESASENASKVAETFGSIKNAMAVRRTSNKDQCSQRTGASNFESDKSRMGESQIGKNVQINEAEMARSGLFGENEGSSCACCESGISQKSSSKTKTILDRGAESDCCGKDKVVLGKAQEIKIGKISGILEYGDVEIVSLSIEGDHSYVVSELIVHNTPICQSRDGKVYPVDSGPRPPAHIRCRSTTAPVLKSWKELGLAERDIPPGTRASMDGQVPEAETYQTWLKKKSPAFQDDVLGPTRGKLFREGMSLDRFVDQSGKEYTLKQLRSKDATLFRKAGID